MRKDGALWALGAMSGPVFAAAAIVAAVAPASAVDTCIPLRIGYIEHREALIWLEVAPDVNKVAVTFQPANATQPQKD